MEEAEVNAEEEREVEEMIRDEDNDLEAADGESSAVTAEKQNLILCDDGAAKVNTG